jgi:demethylmenaquinone methyltransferase/2-methoxy-6-polyprenyl-1,4-benzoquinol methylase
LEDTPRRAHDLAFISSKLSGCPVHPHSDQSLLFDSSHLAPQVVCSPLQEPTRVRSLFSSIATRYDLANHLLSGGLDFLWRARATAIIRTWQPAILLDLATGSGDLALAIQRAVPGIQVTGADFCEPMLECAREKGLENTVLADALHLPFTDASFDAVTVAFGLRNMESWSAAIREMSRVLTPGGHLLILDFSLPRYPWRGLYRFYLHNLLPAIAGLITGEKSAYEYLAATIEQFPAGAAMRAMIEANGFTASTSEPLTAGIVSIYTGRKL